MRVLTYLHSLSLGGIEVTLLRILPILQSSGVSLDVACSAKGGVLEEKFRQLGVRIIRVPGPRNLLGAVRSTAKLSKDYDIVHSRFGYSSAPHVLGARLAARPSVVSFHNQGPDLDSLGTVRRVAGSMWVKWNAQVIRKHADAIVGHSEANLNAFYPSWRSDERCEVILNGVDLPECELSRAQARASLGLPQDAEVVLHIGSFRKQKNHRGLLSIFERLADIRTRAVLLLAGSGPLEDEIRTKALRLRCSDRVIFLGRQEDTQRLFCAADVFLFPSLSEGYGNVLIEAQSAGVPVVATDIQPHREAVVDVQHEFLFDPMDHDSAVKYLMKQLDSSYAGSNPWTETSKQIVRERNTPERMAKSMISLYERLMEGRAS